MDDSVCFALTTHYHFALKAGGVKIAIYDQYLALSRAVNTMTARCYQQFQHSTAGLWQVVTLTTGSKRRSLLMAGDDDEVFMTRSLNVTPKTTELNCAQLQIVACITNNKRLRSTFCTAEASYWQTRSIRRLLCDSRATCKGCLPGIIGLLGGLMEVSEEIFEVCWSGMFV